MYDKGRSVLAAKLLSDCIGMQDFSRIVHVCHYAMMVEHIAGDIVEFGCYVGNTAKILTHITNKSIHVYDSFEGLPQDCTNNQSRMNEASARLLVQNFRDDGLKFPNIVKGWFSELTADDVPKSISFAHLDGDLYLSVIDPLRLIYNRMSSGGIILIDDYQDPEWPGVEVAVSEFFTDKPEDVVVLPGMNGTLSYKALVVKK